jgi:hypothetical protein
LDPQRSKLGIPDVFLTQVAFGIPIFSSRDSALIGVRRNAHSRRQPGVLSTECTEGVAMRKTVSLTVLLLASVSLQGKDKPSYEKGELVKMDSASCGFAEKDGKTLAGEIFGTDGQHKKTQETLCQEYVLRSQRVTYRIRPKDDKHPALLPIGETAEFRVHKDKLLLRVPEADGKEREYIVLSMTPRTDVAENRDAAAHVNH